MTRTGRQGHETGLAPADVAQLGVALSAFVRAFGLHQPDRTPCGAPLPVSEAHALTELDLSGPLPQHELATRLGLSKGTVSRIVDLLAGRGWARRQASPDDRRISLVDLTEEGRAAAAALAVRRSERLQALLEALPEEDRPTAVRGLALLAEAARASR